jgi:hypothetical protein
MENMMVVLTSGLVVAGDEVDGGRHRLWVMTGSAIIRAAPIPLRR